MIFFSSILVKRNTNLDVLVTRVNGLLRDLCRMNGFGYNCNDTITTEYLNFIKFANSFLVVNVKAIAKLSSYGKKEL